MNDDPIDYSCFGCRWMRWIFSYSGERPFIRCFSEEGDHPIHYSEVGCQDFEARSLNSDQKRIHLIIRQDFTATGLDAGKYLGPG